MAFARKRDTVCPGQQLTQPEGPLLARKAVIRLMGDRGLTVPEGDVLSSRSARRPEFLRRGGTKAEELKIAAIEISNVDFQSRLKASRLCERRECSDVLS